MSKRLLAKEMEVVYFEVDDEDEEDIPDEDTGAEMSIKLYDHIIPRRAITKNITNNSYLIDSPFSNISSVDNDSRRDSNNLRPINRGFMSNQSSFNTPKSQYYDRSNIILPERAMQIINEKTSDRAVYNWAYMFRK
jgi:hypothetical protein